MGAAQGASAGILQHVAVLRPQGLSPLPALVARVGTGGGVSLPLLWIW